MVFLVYYVVKDSSGTISVAFRDPGQILTIRDCPGDSGTVGAYVFAGLWHSCCLGSVLTLFASFLPIIGAIVALHQLSLLLSPGASVEPHGHVTHPGILEASAMLEFSCLRCVLLACHNMYLLAVAYMYSFWP